jgi:hypothetical protein
MKILHRPSSSRLFAAALAAAAILPSPRTEASVQYTQPINWTLQYDASLFPTDPGAIQYSDGTTGPFGEVNSHNLNARVENGILTLDSVDGGRFTIPSGQGNRFLLNSDNGYTVEFRARLIRTVNTTTAPLNLNAAVLQLNDGRPGVQNTVHMGLVTHFWNNRNYAQARGSSLGPAFEIGTDFQTFTFVVTGSSTAFYVNGYFVANLPRWQAVSGREEIWLGDITGTAHIGNFEVDHLKIYDGGAVHPVNLGNLDLSPPLLSLKEPRPLLTGFTREGDEFLLSFKSMLGGNYLVQQRDDLVQAGPNVDSPRVVGTGAVVTARDNITGVDRRFYQVAREPEEITYEQEFVWDLRYEGDVDPLATSAFQYKDGSTAGASVFRTVADKYRNEAGILLLDYPVGQALGGTFDLVTSRWDGRNFVIDPAIGYTVEYRARVDYSMHYGAAVLEINATDINHLVQIGLVTERVNITDPETNVVIGTENRNYVRLQSSGGTPTRAHPLGSGFNTFTLTVKDDLATLFLNGVEIDSTTSIEKTVLNRDFIRFGNASAATNTSRYDVDYFRVYAGGAVRPVSPLQN